MKWKSISKLDIINTYNYSKMIKRTLPEGPHSVSQTELFAWLLSPTINAWWNHCTSYIVTQWENQPMFLN